MEHFTTETALRPSSSADNARRARIRDLNDSFRTSQRPELGRVIKTAGVAALGWGQQFALLEAVKAFDSFSIENDPYGEHDFGALEHGGQRFFWKIDYYDPSLSGGSVDAADTSRTCRVLTVMLASEY